MIAILVNPIDKRRYVEAYFDNLVSKTNLGVRDGLREYGSILVKHAVEKIRDNSGKTGRVYWVRVQGTRRRHRASAPGQYPADMTGGLARSILSRMRTDAEMDFGSIGTSYARSLEFGRGSNRMAPRPFLKPTLLATADSGAGAISKQMEKHLRAIR